MTRHTLNGRVLVDDLVAAEAVSPILLSSLQALLTGIEESDVEVVLEDDASPTFPGVVLVYLWPEQAEELVDILTDRLNKQTNIAATETQEILRDLKEGSNE